MILEDTVLYRALASGKNHLVSIECADDLNAMNLVNQKSNNLTCSRQTSVFCRVLVFLCLAIHWLEIQVEAGIFEFSLFRKKSEKAKKQKNGV